MYTVLWAFYSPIQCFTLSLRNPQCISEQRVTAFDTFSLQFSSGWFNPLWPKHSPYWYSNHEEWKTHYHCLVSLACSKLVWTLWTTCSLLPFKRDTMASTFNLQELNGDTAGEQMGQEDATDMYQSWKSKLYLGNNPTQVYSAQSPHNCGGATGMVLNIYCWALLINLVCL